MTEWIGKPFGKNKPHNFFKTGVNYTPARMFADDDKDGVANVFDCKPHDPKKQGFIDAVIGAVKGIGKGGMKAGWKEGMAVDSKERKRLIQRRATRVKRYGRYQTYGDTPYHTVKELPSVEERIIASVKPKVIKDIQQGRWDAVEDIKTKIHQTPKAMANVVRRFDESAVGKPNRLNRLLKGIKRANPKYSLDMEFRGEKIAQLQKDVDSGHFSGRQLERMKRQLASKRMIQKRDTIRRSSIARDQAVRSLKRGIVETFPVIRQAARGSSGEHLLGAPGQRGRPRGTLDPRYAAYGGVFGYRRAMAAKRKAYKEALRQQMQQIKHQRAVQNSPYEYQEYTQEVQQAMQSQPLEREQAQPQIPLEEYAGLPPQMPQNPQKQVIATVFKGSGGKPYPAVDTTPLANTKQTIPYGYVEDVDSFTGRRFLKRLPPSEKWSSR